MAKEETDTPELEKLSIGSSQDSERSYEGDGDEIERYNREAAASIIGGSSVHVSRSHTKEHGPSSDHTEEDHEIKTSDLDNKRFKNEHKIFTFSLPFGGNPLAHLPTFKYFKNGIPIIGDSSDSDEDYRTSKITKSEIKQKLARQESIDTLQEAYLFRHMKGQGGSRLAAVKRALTPTISIPSLMDDDKKKHETIWNTIDGNIVILGGYRGSILRDAKTKRRVWIPIRAGFNIRKIDLLLGPKDEDEENAYKDIYADDMMTHLGPVDISRKLKSKLENGNTNVQTFGYDWRLSCDINSQKLFEYLSEIKKKSKDGRGTIVIAHSMGGLIAHHAMQKDPSLFRGLIYVGVPSECPNILGPIRYGDSVLFSNKILTPEANFFMRSSFVFLPRDGRCFMDKKTHEKYNLDYFDPEVWGKHNLSMLVSDERPKRHDLDFITSYEDSKDYLARTLKRTRKFIDELEYDETKKYPPLVIVYGNEVPTVRGARVNGLEGIKRGEYNDFYYGPGDGVVHHKWLMPERRGFPVQAKISSDLGHISLMTDLVAMGDALEEIVFAESQIIR